jgi:hypothetical protein
MSTERIISVGGRAAPLMLLPLESFNNSVPQLQSYGTAVTKSWWKFDLDVVLLKALCLLCGSKYILPRVLNLAIDELSVSGPGRIFFPVA